MTVMADTAGQWHAPSGCCDRHRRPVARSNWLLWPTPQALDPNDVNDIKDDLEYYIESNQDADFFPDDEMYDSLTLDDVKVINTRMKAKEEKRKLQEKERERIREEKERKKKEVKDKERKEKDRRKKEVEAKKRATAQEKKREASGTLLLTVIWPKPQAVARSNSLLWPTPQASGTLQFTFMADSTDQWRALIGCYGQHRRPN